MKSKAFILIGLVFAVLLVTSAVAEKTNSKEEKKVNSNPKAEEVAAKQTENGERTYCFDTPSRSKLLVPTDSRAVFR